MAFGNVDPIDRRNREHIRELEVRNHQLEDGLRRLTTALIRSTSMTLKEKEQVIFEARQLLSREGGANE